MIYTIFKNLFKIFLIITSRFQVSGHENIPTSGPVILAANHVSNWDPLLLGSAVKRQVHFIAKEELFRIPIVGLLLHAWGTFPVRRGRGDREAIAKSLEILKTEKVLGIFIEGGRNKGNPDEMRPQSGAAMLATHSGAPVVPVALINTDRLFKKMRVVIGKPLTFAVSEEVPKKELYQQISQELVTAITRLKSEKA
ncbi:MAG TPA: lysophospholipid acyltransferase family protein [Bacillota bacterium]|nr:lysophospholipid acyltransferase family protein [Bacillota bacterium]